jgi:antitoxin component YwqK of YwqJK toxin-antitoxin module
VDQLDAAQYNSRMHLIEVLDGYRKAGIFPMNYYRHERVPVFIDEHKTHCAVGYLLQQTGYEEMALRIAATNNYAWLKDIHDAEFPAWQKSSGFTIEELKLIQGAYDFYLDNAFSLPDKYEIPQKPACILVYFNNDQTGRQMAAKPENIWCKGEGVNGVLNGKWEQHAGVGMPWIVGYYENGKRTGQWEEYYQGTKQLCRTEHWRNNKLNGIRKRFDMEGNLIEELLFKDGNAVTKKNFDLNDSLVYIRKPLDSNRVWTEIYTLDGSLIAAGREKVYNPGNLQWFQNIELTALNSAAITARDRSTSLEAYSGGSGFRRRYYTPPLVEYKKEGDWLYYKEYNYDAKPFLTGNKLLINYHHFGQLLLNSLSVFDEGAQFAAYDSIVVGYSNNYLNDFYGYSANNFKHLKIRYYDQQIITATIQLQPSHYLLNGNSYTAMPVVKECGEYNKAKEKIGEWKHFDKTGRLYSTENYLVAWKEDD